MHVPLIRPIDLLILFLFSLVTSTTLTQLVIIPQQKFRGKLHEALHAVESQKIYKMIRTLISLKFYSFKSLIEIAVFNICMNYTPNYYNSCIFIRFIKIKYISTTLKFG